MTTTKQPDLFATANNVYNGNPQDSEKIGRQVNLLVVEVVSENGIWGEQGETKKIVREAKPSTPLRPPGA
jgi:hypothetical protein